MCRSKESQISPTYAQDITGHQSSYLVQLNILLPLICGLQAVSWQSFCLDRFHSCIQYFAFVQFLILITFIHAASVPWGKWSWSAGRDYQGNIFLWCPKLFSPVTIDLDNNMFSHSTLQVLGTPTREEIKCMNPNYTEFKFPQIKAHPWHKVFCPSLTKLMQYRCPIWYILLGQGDLLTQITMLLNFEIFVEDKKD